ncbi:MAG: ERF family protein [Pseudomonadota bacterium]
MTSSVLSQGQTSLAPTANRDKIIPAFFKAKSIFEPVVRNRTNPSYKSAYADLSAIEEAITLGLTKYGLFYQQLFQIEPGVDDGQFVLNVEVILWHRSGQALSNIFTVPYKGGEIDLHSMGSFITYFRRYSLLSFLGLATYDNSDDDGNRGREGDRHNVGGRKNGLPSVKQTLERMQQNRGLTSPTGVDVEPDVELAVESVVEQAVEPDNDESQTASPEKIAVLSSLFGQLPSERRDQFIVWCLEKGYYSEGTNSFNFDLIEPETLERVIENCNEVIAENHELDGLKQDILSFLETHKDIDILALGREIGVESVESVQDFSLEQLRELRELCRQKLATAWDAAKAKANSGVDETISQSQKEEIQRLWNESLLGTDALFEYLSTTYKFKIQSWEDIPTERFDEICNALPDISEEFTQRFSQAQDKDGELGESELAILNRAISMSDEIRHFVLNYLGQEGCKGIEELSSEQLCYLLEEMVKVKADEHNIPSAFLGFYLDGRMMISVSDLSDSDCRKLLGDWPTVISEWEKVRSLNTGQVAQLRAKLERFSLSEKFFMEWLASNWDLPKYIVRNGQCSLELEELPEQLFRRALESISNLKTDDQD